MHTIAHTSIDLDVYASNYSGHGKLARLLFIAQICPTLRVDALKMAALHIKDTLNVEQGHILLEMARKHSVHVAIDDDWLEKTKRQAKSIADKLELELRHDKANMIRESIRMGHYDLAEHYYACGDLTNAMKFHIKTRDHCSTSKHIVDMALNVIKVAFEQQNFANVMAYCAKVEQLIDLPDKDTLLPRIELAKAMSHLDSGKFHQAAQHLTASLTFNSNLTYSHLVSHADIAIYGGLCALASMDRTGVKAALDHPEFKQFLELEPTVRDLMGAFTAARYAHCLDLMCRMQNDLYLDLFLHSHVDRLFEAIRKRLIIQYCAPYEALDLNKMAVALQMPYPKLEEEMTRMILSGDIAARIDGVNKVLRAKKLDLRAQLFQKASELGEEYSLVYGTALLRLNALRKEVTVTTAEK